MDETFDAAVVGAGPAGSMAAWGLARAGLKVVLLDRALFPRDKVCGDALLPDAVQALEEAGLADAVRERALGVASAVFRSPGGHTLRVGGDFLTIRRAHFDATLVEAAVQAGARLMAGVMVTGPVEERGEIAGLAVRLHERNAGAPADNVVQGRAGGSSEARVRARVVVLACGSQPRTLEAFDVLTRPIHSAVALRGYLPYDPFPELSASGPSLFISYDRALLPGYGWSFPMPGGEFNVGCGVFLPESEGRGKASGGRGRPVAGRASPDLRALLERFLGAATQTASGGLRGSSSRAGSRGPIPPRPSPGQTVLTGPHLQPGHAQAGTVPSSWWRSLQGATLRTGFTGAQPVRGRVVVVGEALGLTLPLTGDGIGKAMQSGLIAARAIADALRRTVAAPDLGAYARELEERTRRTHDAYAAAQRWMQVSAVPDLIVRRAARSASIRRLVEEIVAERTDPRRLLSPLGILRALAPRFD